jgi:nucleoid-associated protein YgaU
MIFEGSRYQNETVRRVPDHRGVTHPTLYPQRHDARRLFSYRTHRSVIGDRFDVLAHRVLGDAELWWRIADLNPEVFYPDAIPEGTTLRIPEAAEVNR